MLPEASEEPQSSLPCISNIVNDVPVANQMEELYLYDQYAQSPLLNYTYPPQPIMYTPWTYNPQPSFDIYHNYPVMNPYDQTFAPSQPVFHNMQSFDTSFDSTSTASPEAFVKKKRSNGSARNYQRKLAKLSTRDVTCSNCSTSSTTLWRKNDEGNLECNACNLYYRHNKTKRPLSLCKDRPATRKRRKEVKKEPSSEDNYHH